MHLKILKVLNNNTAVVISDDGKEEAVVMGKGISFQRKPGDSINQSKIDKTFSLTKVTPERADRFQKILSTIPSEHFLVAEDVIKYAEKRLGKMDDCIYITLPDHLSSAIERYRKGIKLKNPLTEEIRRLYQAEFQVGTEAARLVRNRFHIIFLDDEKAFIAMHFVNARLNTASYKMDNIYMMTYMIQEIVDLVGAYFHLNFDANSLPYFRFITHLKFFTQRLFSETDNCEGNGDEDLYSMIQKRYSKSFHCVQKIRNFLIYRYHYAIGHEEMTYLAIHIHQIIENLSV